MNDNSNKPDSDLDSSEAIARFVDSFYGRLSADEQLAPLFFDVAQVDLDKHKPLIVQYWEKLLLGGQDYNRHTMNIHRALDSKQQLTEADFERWLQLFTESVGREFAGPLAERAKRIAATIAGNMKGSLQRERST